MIIYHMIKNSSIRIVYERTRLLNVSRLSQRCFNACHGASFEQKKHLTHPALGYSPGIGCVKIDFLPELHRQIWTHELLLQQNDGRFSFRNEASQLHRKTPCNYQRAAKQQTVFLNGLYDLNGEDPLKEYVYDYIYKFYEQQYLLRKDRSRLLTYEKLAVICAAGGFLRILEEWLKRPELLDLTDPEIANLEVDLLPDVLKCVCLQNN